MAIRAPLADGATVCYPPLADWPAGLASNRHAREAWSAAPERSAWREQIAAARRQLLAAAVEYTNRYDPRGTVDLDRISAGPIVVGGHQPQLVHPGVWLKNVALSRFAKQIGGTAVQLIIDSDALKSAEVPILAGTRDAPRRESIPWDTPGSTVPWEERSIVDRDAWKSFAERGGALVHPWVAEPFVFEYWPRVVARSEVVDRPGLALAQARHQVERRWGLETWELPQSAVCQFPAFRWFVAEWLMSAERLRGIYNAAVQDFRRRHGLRSMQHPVPDLSVGESGSEVPLWLYSEARPQRRRVWAARDSGGIRLSDGHAAWNVGATSAELVEGLADLEGRGIKLRTRALLTTLFARVVLGDWFIHGIGGGHYDEVTDTIVTEWLGLAAPGFAMVSGTLRLVPRGADDAGADVAELRRRLWQLRHQPERAVSGIDPVPASWRALIGVKEQLLRERPAAGEVRAWCRALREVNGAMQSFVEPLALQWREAMESARQAQRRAEVLHWREYPSVWHACDKLSEFCTGKWC